MGFRSEAAESRVQTDDLQAFDPAIVDDLHGDAAVLAWLERKRQGSAILLDEIRVDLAANPSSMTSSTSAPWESTCRAGSMCGSYTYRFLPVSRSFYEVTSPTGGLFLRLSSAYSYCSMGLLRVDLGPENFQAALPIFWRGTLVQRAEYGIGLRPVSTWTALGVRASHEEENSN